MILGGLAANTSATLAELDALDIDAARFWWNVLVAWHERVREESR